MQKTRSDILDLMSYFAVFNLQLTIDEILSLMPTKIGYYVLKSNLDYLVKSKKLKKTGKYYGLCSVIYPSPLDLQVMTKRLTKKAKRWARFFAILPFIKSIVVVNSVSFGNVHKDSDIDFLIITKPNRIYLTKGILMYSLKFLGRLETIKKKASRFSLGMFLDTNGVNFKKDIMKTNYPHLDYWLIMAKPIYGAQNWYGLIRNKAKLSERFPNYKWPKTSLNIYPKGLSLFDLIDEIGYRKHLKHTASQSKNSTPSAFIRLRPDIINLHALDKSSEIALRYKKIRDSF